MTSSDTHSAYAARAAEYIELFGDIDSTDERDRQFIVNWARGTTGPLLDVGCGPGQWTDVLRRQGVDVIGIDSVPEFIASARQTFPDAVYRLGDARQLDADDSSVGGILAWYSLIHTGPDEIDDVLAEFARVVRPGGGLALGFFTGPCVVVFDHAVAPAWFWPIEELSERLARAGFEVTHTDFRDEPEARPHGAIVARRNLN